MNKKPDCVHAIIDGWKNEHQEFQTPDRLTVIIKQSVMPTGYEDMFACLCLSNDPTGYNGFSQFGECSEEWWYEQLEMNRETDWDKLPEHIQEHIIARLED